MSVLTSEVSRGAGGCWRSTHVRQLIRLIPAVVVTIAHKILGHTAAILAGELVGLTGLIRAALLIAAVPTVITAVTPNLRRAQKYIHIARQIPFHISLGLLSKRSQ